MKETKDDYSSLGILKDYGYDIRPEIKPESRIYHYFIFNRDNPHEYIASLSIDTKKTSNKDILKVLEQALDW